MMTVLQYISLTDKNDSLVTVCLMSAVLEFLVSCCNICLHELILKAFNTYLYLSASAFTDI